MLEWVDILKLALLTFLCASAFLAPVGAAMLFLDWLEKRR